MKNSLMRSVGLIFLSVACLSISSIYCYEIPVFNSIEKIQKYARLADEHGQHGIVQSQESRNLTTRIARFFGVAETLWEPGAFKKLLKTVIKERRARGFLGDCIEKIEPEPGRNFVIFGPLEGQFHSFARCLQHLVQLKVLDNNLKIINPSYAIIFNGNAGFDNFYDLEILTVILQLMRKNKDKIFYIKNTCEDNNAWRKTHLMTQLKGRLQLFNLQVHEYASLIDQFFNTVARALFLVNVLDEKNIDLVKCVNIPMELHEEDLTEFFMCPDNCVVALKFLLPQKSRMQTHLSAVITAHRLFDLNVQAEMLKYHVLNDGVTQWSLGSLTQDISPKHDFFSVVMTAKNLDAWVLALFGSLTCQPLFERIKAFNLVKGQFLTEPIYQSRKKQVLNERLDFFESEIIEQQRAADELKLMQLEIELASLENRPINPDLMKTVRKEVPRSFEALFASDQTVMSGHSAIQPLATLLQTEREEAERATTTNVPSDVRQAGIEEENVVKIGTSMDLSRSIKNISSSVRAGMELVINQFNMESGVHGKHLELHVLDDEYREDKASENMDGLTHSFDTNIILCPIGSPPFEGYKVLIKNSRLGVFFPLVSSSSGRSPDYKNVIFYRASSIQESAALARYALKELNSKKISILYQGSISDAKDGALNVFKQLHFDSFQLIEYSEASVDFAAHVKSIQKFEPDTIIMLMIPIAARAFVHEIKNGVLRGKKLLGYSDLHEESFRAFLSDLGLPIVVSSIVPDPMSSLPLAQEFRAVALQRGLKPNVFMFEGYLSTKIFTEQLKKIEGVVTNEKLLRECEALKNIDFHGLKLNFDPETRTLSSAVWLDKGEGEWLKMDV